MSKKREAKFLVQKSISKIRREASLRAIRLKKSPVGAISGHDVAHSFIIIIPDHRQKLSFRTKFVLARGTSVWAIGAARTIILTRLVFI